MSNRAKFTWLMGFFVGLFGSGCAPEAIDENVEETSAALAQGLGIEVEPNDSPATATPVGIDSVVRANIFADGDVDYFSFSGIAGDRIYVAVMTAASATGWFDSQLRLFQPDGTTLIEFDDDAGTLGSTASVISGALLTQSGTHYIRVNHYTPVLGYLLPYDLHLKVQRGAPVVESEPNDTNPNVLPLSGWVSGTLGSLTDVDTYAVQLNAGDTIYVNLDLDPTRNGTEWNGQVQVEPFGVTNAALVANDKGNTMDPDGEAMMVTVQNPGTYRVKVSLQGGTVIDDYQLSAAVHPATSIGTNCTTYTSTDLPQTIPTGPGGITSTIVVPGHPQIEDLDVSLVLNHAAPFDLDVYVTSPAGNTNALVTNVGGGAGTPFTNWNFTLDDQAAFPAGAFSLFQGLVVQPEKDYRLGWFKGEDAGGTWTLNVLDDTASNGGTFTSWSLRVCAPAPAPKCANGTSLGPVWMTDFESGAAGFTHSGTQDEWALGTPTAAPIASCNSGTKCWKTDLTGPYNSNSSQNLVSPPIDLTNSSAPIQLRWAMKYQMDTVLNDHASITIQEVGGANPRQIWQHLDALMRTNVGNPSNTLQQTAGWGRWAEDISSYAGKQIEVVFHLDSNMSTELAGLAIDDVSVMACPMCGNGITNVGEECDDKNLSNGDGCDNNCTTTKCGNGVSTMGEACDDGNQVDGDGCDSNCTMTGCGNGITTGIEQCDDGNLINGDGCDNNCTTTKCGNGIVTGVEECDDGNATNGDGCDGNCTTTKCGNGIVTGTEECDDGNLVDGDGCDSNCTMTACGNGITTSGEVCDDGNTMSGDGCDDNCTLTGCGNGVVALGEACDDGNGTNDDECDSNCTWPACGNGIRNANEICDDGNVINGDGCDSNCSPTSCGNGLVTPGEICDDGNVVDGDECDSNCTPPACGNGVIAGSEACDDGNLLDGDGCSAACQVEMENGSSSSSASSSSTGSGGYPPEPEPAGCTCTIPGKTPTSGASWAVQFAAIAMCGLRRRAKRRAA